ncbi:alpha-mannosidase [Paenibacillus filicis]|uniref:Alpha-mannosidase n=1 Tax=Paenibacillus filicis TaxID=669464 RepID=A0ABU9DDS1_9BACL
MFWTEEKLEQRIKELEKYRYRDAVGLNEWDYQVDEEKANGVQHPPEGGQWTTIRQGEHWKGRDLYVWLRRQVDIPADWEGRTPVGLFDFGRTGAGNNSGFESLLYVNGTPYQGVDSNHLEVFLSGHQAGSRIELSFRIWAGLEGGGPPTEQEHQFKRAELAWLDEAADDLYYTGRAVLHTSRLLGEQQPERQELLKTLDRAFLRLDWSRPGSETFYASVRDARDFLAGAVSGWEKKHAVTVRCIGHTHIDVAWLWRLTHTREKAARSFSTVLRLMEKYPDYVFLQSQPQLYAYIKEDYPEIYEQIKLRVQEGRWEAGGAMWLEADCNLTSGESLVRQILYGTRFFRDEFGVECTYLWLPDVFGYSWALPQILKKSGIRTFMTTKISWNQYNRMPHDTFRWRGMDGSEVLTHFVTTPEVPGSTVWWYTYNGLIEPFSVKGIWDTYRDKNVNQELLLSYGYGDGGGGVNRDMLEMRRRLDQMPGLPQVTTGRADEYFDSLHDTVNATDQYVHTWDGELYLEYHRGTYTSQAYNKRTNRKLELLYRESEWLQTLGSVAGGTWQSYPQSKLHQGWQIILRNQFHDIIPGSSITEVYEDCRVEYAEAERLGREAWEAAAVRLADEDGISTDGASAAWTIFNSASFARTEAVRIRASAGHDGSGSWQTSDGHTLQADWQDGKWLIRVEDIPALSGLTIRWTEAQDTAATGALGGAEASESSELLPASNCSPFTFTVSELTTPHYVLAWNEAGQLTRIYDKAADREVLEAGKHGNVLQVFEDKPKMFEAWDIDLFYQEKQREIGELQAVELVENGLLRAVVRFTWTYMDSSIRQELIVYADSKRIDFATEVDWHERQQLLKVAFPVSVRSTEATYDIQFGNVKRPTHWNTSWDYARFETVGHQWVDLSERGYGVSLLNDCKYGHDIKDNAIRLSLIKSAIEPDTQADQGTHTFTYALLPHQGDWVEGRTVQEAWSLNNPLTLAAGASAISLQSLLKLDAEHVFIDAVKKAEDSERLIVRLHEYTGARGKVRLTSDFRLLSWQETDLLERPVSEEQQGAEVSFDIKPYEIKTFLLDLQR